MRSIALDGRYYMMKASRLNAIKDAASLAILFGLLAGIWVFAMPEFQSGQLGLLEDQYIDEQRRIVAQTVANAGERLVTLRDTLLGDGMAEDAVEAVMLSQLEAERFGVNGYGYFYAFNLAGIVIMQPVIPELVGRNIADIVSPGGVNMGAIFSAALGGADSGYVSYDWAAPGFIGPERKTAFFLRVPYHDWIIVSGFYHSDLRDSLDRFASLSSGTVRRFRVLVAPFLAAVLLILAMLSAISRSRILTTERALARQLVSLEQYKMILDQSSMVSRTDTDGIITYVNDAFCETTGYTRDCAMGKSHNIERHPDTPREVFKEMWGTIGSGKVWRGVIKNRRADGSSYFKRATIVPIADEGGRIVEYISSGQDITELVDKGRELEDAFLTDSLTGLGNRIHLLRDIGKAESPCVYLADIESFSAINRAFGTEIGDEVLKQLAEAMLELAMERGYTAYRIHADTFAMLGEPAEPEDIASCAEALAKRLRAVRVEIQGTPTAVIARVGAASAGKDSFLFADAALKRVKGTHKAVRIYDPSEPDADGDAIGNLEMLKTMASALENDRVFVAFQPIVEVSTRKVVKYECLMRLEDEEGKTVMPDDFLEVSKKTGLYRLLTARVIDLSIEAFRYSPYDFSVNLTIDDLMNPDTIAYLLSEAMDKGVSSRLIVEIVETEELHDFEGAEAVLRKLRSEGVRIAVDDFGSGYSSFEYLLKLNPEFVKIDQAIVRNLLGDGRAKEMVKSIAQFAKRSGMRTVAEYIDSEALLDEIRALGIDYAQGWLFGKAERRRPD